MGLNKAVSSLIVVLLISLILLEPAVTKAANDSNFNITQVDSKLPDLKLFVRLDNINLDNAQLKNALKIKINDTPTQLTGIQDVKTDNGGTVNTSYLILVDTSVSMGSENRASQTRVLLEKLFEFVGPNDQLAVFGVSNKLETIKDFAVSDSSQSTIKAIQNSISVGSGTGTHLYSGMRDAIDIGRTAKDIPEQRIVVLITDGGVDGDSFSSEDVQKYVDIDRLPVYTLIINKQNSLEQEFKVAADQIAQKTGGQYFISASGKELFANFKSSIEKCKLINLRCDNFKVFNQQAVIHVAFKDRQGEIRQAAKFTAVPALTDKGNSSQVLAKPKQELRTSYFGVAMILLPFILITLFLILVMMWLFKKPKGESQQNKTESNDGNEPRSTAMLVQNSQGISFSIGLEVLQGTNKGEVIQIQADRNPLIGSAPECALQVGYDKKIIGHFSVIDGMIVIHSQTPGEIYVNGIPVQGSCALQNGDLIRVPEMMYRIVM
ncbi:VWA domain-containing protein [Desulfosporosinus sp. FKA]|uniref:VWA domain-containing protein n=1 Tax=Desulfosporosinus sp. FKA TaxID=1969834 RepID=UPI000B4996CA|nr:VWA domain-containing protein [Desulfosporosinus sp. FKA]